MTKIYGKEWKCDDCGCHDIEEIMVKVVKNSIVKSIDDDDDVRYVEYFEYSETYDGYVECYQCYNCGKKVKIEEID